MSAGAGDAATLTRERGAPLLAALAERLPGATERSELAARVGTELAAARELAAAEVALIAEAARLHEIGKLYVASELLQRPPLELLPSEREALERHPVHGRALTRGAGIPERPCAWIEQARERWDGGGPEGVAGTEIPLEARIIAVAREYVDAPLMVRRGQAASPLAAAVQRLQGLSGTVLDPNLAETAIRLAGTAEAGET